MDKSLYFLFNKVKTNLIVRVQGTQLKRKWKEKRAAPGPKEIMGPESDEEIILQVKVNDLKANLNF